MSFANREVAQEIAGRTVDCGVAEAFEREALTGIFDPAYNRTTHADERNFHILARVEMPAMLHAVQENFRFAS